MACVCAMYENREATKNPIEVLLLTAIFSLCWPVVAVIVAGMVIRRMLVKGA